MSDYNPLGGEDWHETPIRSVQFMAPIRLLEAEEISGIEHGADDVIETRWDHISMDNPVLDVYRGKPHSVRVHVYIHDEDGGITPYPLVVPWHNIASIQVEDWGT